MIDGRMCFLCQFIPRGQAKELRDLRSKEDGGSVLLQHVYVIAPSAFREVAFSL